MEKEISTNVQYIISFFKKNKIWYNITWNNEASSCADAANKRNRLGNIGIPLCDELKSNIGFYNLNGKRNYLLIHCRGNQKIDEEKINKIIGSEFTRLTNEELWNLYNSEYGLVNPFKFALDFPEIEHVFDESVLEDFFPPYTLTTNAGDKNWGIEFKAIELINVLSNVKIRDVITENSKILIRKHKIGILTGNSPESGIFLWQKINENIRNTLNKKNDFLGDLSFPAVLVESIPEMGLSMELDKRLNETKRVVEEGITSLCNNGATIIGIACNTTQYFSEKVNEICEKFGAEHFSMVDAVDSYLSGNNIKHFDFIGIKFVTNFDKYSGFQKLKDKYDIEIPSSNVLNQISDLAFEVKKKVVSPKGINSLRKVIRKSAKTKVIIIALTEISILLSTQKKKRKDDDKLYIDTLSLLANKIAERYLSDYSELLILNQRALSEKDTQYRRNT